MVVSALIQLAIAGPTGILFGLGYGTAIRIGYEQLYPLLFGDKSTPQSVTEVMGKLETTYDAIGGKEAHMFGINQGIKNALKEIEADPELVELIKKNLYLDGQNITVNLSGTSTSQSDKESSPLTIDTIPDTTGGLADRHRTARVKLNSLMLQGVKADAQEWLEATQTYSALFKLFESQHGKVTQAQLQLLNNVNERPRIWFVTWNSNWFTIALKKEIMERTIVTKTTTIEGIQITKHTDAQLLQMFGGKSSQTLTIGLNEAKAKLIPLRNQIKTLTGIASPTQVTANALQFVKSEFAKVLQRIWDITHELIRRAK